MHTIQSLSTLHAFSMTQTAVLPLLECDPSPSKASMLVNSSLGFPPSPPTHHLQSTSKLSTQLPVGMQLAKSLLEAAAIRPSPSTSSYNSDEHAIIVIGKVCHEGDNLLEGLEMASHVMNAMFAERGEGVGVEGGKGGKKFSIGSMSMPESWRVRMFMGGGRGQAPPVQTSDMFY